MHITPINTEKVNACEAALVSHGYKIGPRDYAVNPGFEGRFMVTDPFDEGGFAIVGDHRAALVLEAHDHLLT